MTKRCRAPDCVSYVSGGALASGRGAPLLCATEEAGSMGRMERERRAAEPSATPRVRSARQRRRASRSAGGAGFLEIEGCPDAVSRLSLCQSALDELASTCGNVVTGKRSRYSSEPARYRARHASFAASGAAERNTTVAAPPRVRSPPSRRQLSRCRRLRGGRHQEIPTRPPPHSIRRRKRPASRRGPRGAPPSHPSEHRAE